jgi:AbrB family looped-hinge helix DNA binding protein
MRVSIDQAGRVVIPAQIRAKAGFTPGTELELVVEDTGIRLVRYAPPPKVVRKGKRRVVRPATPQPAEVDVAALIEEERDRWPL